jgi:hypothetical protein
MIILKRNKNQIFSDIIILLISSRNSPLFVILVPSTVKRYETCTYSAHCMVLQVPGTLFYKHSELVWFRRRVLDRLVLSDS